MTYMRYYREAQGLTQTRLSKMTRIPQAKLSLAEKGKHRFSYERTVKLAKILLPETLDPEMLYAEYR